MTKKTRAERIRQARSLLHLHMLTTIYRAKQTHRTAKPVATRRGVIGRSTPTLFH